MKFILGSSSPRRIELLSSIFESIEVVPPNVNEAVFEGESPEDYVERIVNKKMNFITSMVQDEGVYLTSDTIVTIDGKILGKPSSFEDAFSMLSMLSGREHRVITGISLGVKKKNFLISDTAKETSLIKFKVLDENDIKKYLSIVNYTDKAGAYAIQENGNIIIENFSGSITNIIGLPLRLLFSMMVELDVIKYFV